MDGVLVPYLPTSLWVLASAATAGIAITVLGLYSYLRKRMRAALKDSGDTAHLAAQKERLEKDVEELRLWIATHKDELLQLTAERQQQESERAKLDQLIRDFGDQDQKNQQLRNEVGQLENDRHILSQTSEELKRQIEDHEKHIEVLKNEIGELEPKRSQIRELEARITSIQEEMRAAGDLQAKIAAFSAEKTALEEVVDNLRRTSDLNREDAEKYGQEAINTRNEVKNAAKRLADLREEEGTLESQINKYRLEESQLKDSIEKNIRDIEILEKRMVELQNESSNAIQEANKDNEEAKLIRIQLEKARKDLGELQAETDKSKRELQELRGQELDLKNAIDSNTRHIEALKQRIEELAASTAKALKNTEENVTIETKTRKEVEKAERQLSELIRSKQNLELSIGEMNTYKIHLQQDIDGLEKTLRGEGTKDSVFEPEDPYYDLLRVVPPCLSTEKFLPDTRMLSEIDLLEELRQTLAADGLRFSDRVIYSFHTSLKCHSINPLTVLAGVSGTGKTILPLKYAETMGMHSLVISVQPRWDSPQDMFGFYNYLEKKYKATELARALIRMDQYNDFRIEGQSTMRNRILLVLLDEMNLARTEYYFSEFLSKLELRRLVIRPNDRSNREQAEIILDTGPDKNEPFRIWVGENVIFVGTMNEDETTQTLSDKVLDRANVIRFGKPTGKVDEEIEIFEKNTEKQADRAYLELENWRRWVRPYKSDDPWMADVEKWTDDLNEILYSIGRPFGYRVQKTIKKYVANYPGVTDGGDKIWKLAFADQVEQKIIPKLRGLDLQDHGSALQEIFQVIQKLNDDPLTEAFIRAKDDAILGMFLWRGVPRPV